MKLRLLSAAALVFAVVTPGVSFARTAADPGTLVLSGTGSGHVDLTLAHAVGFGPRTGRLGMLPEAGSEVAGSGILEGKGWSWSGCGRLRGFYLEPLDNDPMHGVGAVDFADLRFGAVIDPPWLQTSTLHRVPIPLGAAATVQPSPVIGRHYRLPSLTLPAGRYRAHLLCDGAGRVTIPLGGSGPALRRTVHAVSRVQWADAPLDPLSAAGAPAIPAPRAGAVTFPVTIRPTTLAVVIVHETDYDPQQYRAVSQAVACVQTVPGPACVRGASGGPSGNYTHTNQADALTGNSNLSVTDYAVWYAPGHLLPGPQTAKATAQSDSSTGEQAAMFALDL